MTLIYETIKCSQRGKYRTIDTRSPHACPCHGETKVKSGIEIIKAIAEAIREAKSIPSGTLYVGLMGIVTLESYNKILEILKNAGLIKVSNFLITWEGK